MKTLNAQKEVQLWKRRNEVDQLYSHNFSLTRQKRCNFENVVTKSVSVCSRRTRSAGFVGAPPAATTPSRRPCSCTSSPRWWPTRCASSSPAGCRGCPTGSWWWSTRSCTRRTRARARLRCAVLRYAAACCSVLVRADGPRYGRDGQGSVCAWNRVVTLSVM